jgi:hypothetical protein
VPLQDPTASRVDIAKGAVVARAAFGPDASCRTSRASPGWTAFVVCEGDHKEAGAVVEIDPTTPRRRSDGSSASTLDGIAFSGRYRDAFSGRPN